MDNTHKIILILTDSCKECDRMKQTIQSVIRFGNIKAEVLAYNFDDAETIDVAIAYEIDDVPGCNINGTVIEGKYYNTKALVRELEKLS